MSLFIWYMKPHISHDGGEGIPNNIMGCNLSHHGNNEKGVSPLDLKVGHKCIESTWKLKDGGGPIWCTM
jgi:hypothetical protein